MNRKNTAARKYLKQTDRQLTCGMRQRRRLISDLKRTIGIFLDDCPDASYEDFLEAFGSLADMAAEMLRDVPEQEIHRTVSRKTRMRRAQVAVLLAVSACACAVAVFFYWQRENNPHEIETVVYENETQLPTETQNGLRYGLSYQLDKNGRIIAAFDKGGHAVAVNAEGIPLEDLK